MSTITAIPVFYDDRMVADVVSFSPSAGKPKEVVNSWLGLGIPLSIAAPTPITREQLYLAHTQNYVNNVLDCVTENGFGTIDPAVSESLRWTNGAVLSAARSALHNRCVAVAPASGFHHASLCSGAGYCSFNGLMVAACTLLHECKVSRVGILDLDMHYGNGTDDIIDKLGLSGHVTHFSAGLNWYQSRQAKTFLQMLPDLVEAFADCDLLIFQAGADCHKNDPLGVKWTP